MILALETATTACSAALCAADGAVVAERVSLEGPAHTQRLLPFVRQVFEEAAVEWSDVDTIAVGLGPGAFTGLRIGIATARALAQADGRVRLSGIPTTAALALALRERALTLSRERAAVALTPDEAAAQAPPTLYLPLIDGKRREVFAAVYVDDAAGSAGLRLLEDVSVIRADDLGGWLEAHGPALVGGDAVALYADRLPASARPAAGIVAPTAAMVGRAVACGAPGLVSGPSAVLPLYGRTPDATWWQGSRA